MTSTKHVALRDCVGKVSLMGACYRYHAYGLGIRSNFPLPAIGCAEAATADLSIRLRPCAPISADWKFGQGVHYLAWPSVAGFWIYGTELVEVIPASDSGRALLHLPLLGPVFGLLLHLRGLLVLHASAVASARTSKVFLGDKAAGKSTIAAAHVADGYRLLADDIVAIDLSDPNKPVIFPGFPFVKLRDDAIRSVFPRDDPERYPAQAGKRQRSLPRGFVTSGVPVSDIYVLERGELATMHLLEMQDAFMALTRYSYIPRLGAGALTKNDLLVHMRQCATVAATARVFRLQVPSRLDRLDEAVDLVTYGPDCESG